MENEDAMMKMYFHFSAAEVPFVFWGTHNAIEMVFSSLFYFVLAFGVEAVKVSRTYLHHKKGNPSSPIQPSHMVQTLLHLFQVFLAYIVMLALMSFNGWICLSIVFGHGLGYFALTWKNLAQTNNKTAPKECHQTAFSIATVSA